MAAATSAPSRPRRLFLMNHPFVIEQSRASARRLLADADLDDAGATDALYRLALGRPPTERERTIGLAFLASGESGRRTGEETWAMLFRRCSDRSISGIVRF